MNTSSGSGIPGSHDSDSELEFVAPLRTSPPDSGKKKTPPEANEPADGDSNNRDSTPANSPGVKKKNKLAQAALAPTRRDKNSTAAKSKSSQSKSRKGNSRSDQVESTSLDELRKLSPFATVSEAPQLTTENESTDEDGEPVTISDRIVRHRHPISSLLTSTFVHLTLLTIFALWLFHRQPPKSIGIIAEIESAVSEVVEEVSTEKVKVDVPDEAESPLEAFADSTSLTEEASAASDVPAVSMANESESTPTIIDAKVIELPNHTFPTGGGLEGRDAVARARLAATQGGSAASEAAVEKGLVWIIQHQRTDGSWRFRHKVADCDCGQQGNAESRTAATGLALMSLLGAGYTHKAGPYQLEVQAGLDFLERKVRYTKHGGSLVDGSSGMYSHAIATIALAEGYAMTGDVRYKKAIEAAQQYIVTAQHSAGGWRYNPQQPGDLAVTGWQLMALKACEHAGVKTAPAVFEKAKSFVDSLGSSGGAAYGYQNTKDTPSCSSIGLLCQMYLGWHREKGALEIGTTNIGDLGPSKNDIYFNYYTALAMHHSQSPAWKPFNKRLRDYLIQTQATKGHQAGSWHFEDKHGDVGGRLYTTAMAIMTLEVYYRYMPLYDLKIGSK
jgi:hypothetical protein